MVDVTKSTALIKEDVIGRIAKQRCFFFFIKKNLDLQNILHILLSETSASVKGER